VAPAGTLADVQRIWSTAVGPAVAEQARPSAEHAGVLTVLCSASVWAQELELMGPSLVARLNAALGDDRLTSLRCRTGSL
jgi:predicted nucleic acid-binding Zn ribbon protein